MTQCHKIGHILHITQKIIEDFRTMTLYNMYYIY